VLSVAMNAGKGAAAFVGKWKLQHITGPGGVDVFARPGYLCKKVVDEAAAYFSSKRPQVLFVHFSDPDEEGHSVGWMSEPQLKAIRNADRCLDTLVDAIKSSDVADRTLLIISADHGGHGRNHSGAISEDRLIPWIAWGAGVRPGHRIAAPVSTVDTAATTLWALGYEPASGAVGRPVTEAFQ
jgi:2,3-bisphosphoglycerate-independent phosphoglycerate mutase